MFVTRGIFRILLVVDEIVSHDARIYALWHTGDDLLYLVFGIGEGENVQLGYFLIIAGLQFHLSLDGSSVLLIKPIQMVFDVPIKFFE